MSGQAKNWLGKIFLEFLMIGSAMFSPRKKFPFGKKFLRHQ
jgi:hypothetical protein